MKTANDYANIIMALNTKNAEKPDKGYISRNEWEKIWNMSTAQTNKRLAQLVRNEIMTMKTYRIPTPTRGLYPTPHYKIKCTN